MIQAGCEYVRITAPSMNEAQNLQNIKNELRKRGHKTPLIADIHFTPNAAELAARIVEKVRVNPGNYADRKKFQVIEYKKREYLQVVIEFRIRVHLICVIVQCSILKRLAYQTIVVRLDLHQAARNLMRI